MQQSLLWLLASLSIACLAGAVVWWVRRSAPLKLPALPNDWPLTPRPVFSREERRLYRQLRVALPHFVVLSKLPLVRFCQPADPHAVRYWYNLLGSSHVTFAVCSANGRVLAAIDLGSDRGSARRGVQIKQSVLAACKVKHLRCTPGHLPSIAELQMLVPRSTGGEAGARSEPATDQAADSAPGPLLSRRRERSTHWQSSSYTNDSFFNPDSRNDADSPHPGLTVSELPLEAEDVGGIVSDAPPPASLRH